MKFLYWRTCIHKYVRIFVTCVYVSMLCMMRLTFTKSAQLSANGKGARYKNGQLHRLISGGEQRETKRTDVGAGR